MPSESLFDLALFIVTSVRTTIDEPKRYGPRRLLECLEKVVNLPLTDPNIPDDPFFQRIRNEIASHPNLQSSSVVFSDEFRAFIDRMVADFIDEMKRRQSITL